MLCPQPALATSLEQRHLPLKPPPLGFSWVSGLSRIARLLLFLWALSYKDGGEPCLLSLRQILGIPGPPKPLTPAGFLDSCPCSFQERTGKGGRIRRVHSGHHLPHKERVRVDFYLLCFGMKVGNRCVLGNTSENKDASVERDCP